MKTCREIHQLVVLGADRELAWRERLAIRLHLLVCAACRRFEAQMHLIEMAWKQFPGPQGPEQGAGQAAPSAATANSSTPRGPQP